MRLNDFLRSTTFRWTLIFFGAFAALTLFSFTFVYLRATTYMVTRVDTALADEADLMTGDAPERRLQALEERMRQDPRRIKLGALFDADGKRIAGNIESVPADLPVGAVPQRASVVRIDRLGRERQIVCAVARRLPNGELLVLGRNIDELGELAEILESGLAVGLVPALLLGLAAGIILSVRSQRRVEEVNQRVQRIVAGELRQRLPTRGINDPFDKLATIVNGMLDEIETLVRSMAEVGDDMAHDLRTPLTRVRVCLERSCSNARSLPELQGNVDKAIAGIDQTLSMITALLRIREIEQTRRMDGFGDVDLAELVREVGDLYEPFAEQKRVSFIVDTGPGINVRGDRDLLFEAIANLVDNAVKFTPSGGKVELGVVGREREALVRVKDSGPGVVASERDLIVRRFYRSDKSRHTHGLGLGLSLVTAIVKLHGYRFNITPGPGFLAEIAAPRTAVTPRLRSVG